MRFTRQHRRLTLVAGATGMALALASCGAGGDDGGDSGDGGDAASGDCAAFEDYGTFDGAEVSIYSPIRDAEADLLEESWAEFTDCTGIDIAYEGSGEFEAQLNVRVEGGNAPDIAFFPQPGLLQRFAASGDLVAAPEQTESNVDEGWTEDWKAYGTVDGEFYGAPLGSNVKSFVWYSPSMFEEAGYEIPETLDDLKALSDEIAGAGDVKPWCAGIESGDATGWPATDWMEDFMLRTAGPEVYDEWVAHEIPFNDPQVVEAAEAVGEYLKNDDYMNGGLGDVQSITTTAFQDGGLPILDGQCYMHRQASFYGAQLGEDVTVGEDGDIFAFYLPSADDTRPTLVAGEFVGAFADREEVQAVQNYLSTVEFAQSRAELGNWLSANKNMEASDFGSNPINELSYEVLQDPEAVVRFDGSDLMPAAVGSGSLWKAMTDWINGADTQEVLDQVEASWPTS
jgi:alpha-glucoside transport system substrate-binding protein